MLTHVLINDIDINTAIAHSIENKKAINFIEVTLKFKYWY